MASSRGLRPVDIDRLTASRKVEEARWRKASSIGVIGTVILHFLLLILFRGATVAPQATSAAAGPPMGDIRPAGGGSGLTMVEVRPQQTPPPEVEIVEPVVVPEEVVIPEEVEVEVEPVEVPEPVPGPATPVPAPSLPGEGGPGEGGEGGQATGPEGSGDGEGGGGDAESGASQVVPPTPRGVFIPPAGRPNSARGQEITVWVFVTEAGRVERGSVRLEPPTSDSRYNQRLIQSVSEWVFDPATQNGQAVSVWYPFQIIL